MKLFKTMPRFSIALALALPLYAQEQEPTPAPQDPDPQAEPARGEEQSLDELLKIQPAGEPRAKTGEPSPLPPPPAPADQPIEDEPTTQPFQLAVEGMQEAADRLGAHRDPGIQTQRVQEQVVRRLDAIISQMRQSQSKSKQQKPQQQDSGSKEQSGQQEQADANQTGGQEAAQQIGSRSQVKSDQLSDEPLKEQFDEWGNLPPRMRDAIRQGFQESFSSLYEELTKRYYTRLAEETP